ncbi:SPFH domain-containing protein [Amycolatopsis sp. MEPSY49]|uniref:SPFH domain-containing protein n=1 Tax=Amycolatopsis sp. MEPSY49 TaxID=3151600 RepID=UPI003EF9097B
MTVPPPAPNDAAGSPDARASEPAPEPKSDAKPEPETGPPPVPIVRTIEVSRASLRKDNPASSGHSAVVYVTKSGDYRLGSGRLTMGELWLATPREMYLVDIQPHYETYSLELPSQEEAFYFTANVRVTWRVHDPVAAVRAKTVEPRAVIRDVLEERLRDITRGFEVEKSASAERQIAHEFRDQVIRVSEVVEVVNCSAVLALEESTRDHIARRTQRIRDRETELGAQELRVLQAEHERALKNMQEKHELELKQERLRFYAEVLREGDINMLALRLSGNKEDIQDVLELWKDQKQLDYDRSMTVLNTLLESRLVTRKDVAGLLADANDTLVGKPAVESGPKPVTAKSSRADLDDEDEDEDDVGKA